MLTIGVITAFLTSLLTPATAIATAGSGLAALVGGLFSPAGRVKLIVGVVGVAAAVIGAVALSAHYEHLKSDRERLRSIEATVTSLGRHLGCPARPPHERDIAACVASRERDAADAQRAAVEDQKRVAAAEIDRLSRVNDDLQRQVDERNRAITEAPAADDGPVPKVVIDNWRRERAERGINNRRGK